MTVQITEMTADDVEAVYEIEKSSFNNPWSLEDIRKTIDEEYGYFYKPYVAKDEDGNIRGFVIVMIVSDEAEIADIAVDLSSRGLGIGKLLLSYALDYARFYGITNIYLEVRETNEVAKSLYISSGFKPIGVRRNYYKNPTEDAIVMKNTLSDKKKEQI